MTREEVMKLLDDDIIPEIRTVTPEMKKKRKMNKFSSFNLIIDDYIKFEVQPSELPDQLEHILEDLIH